MLNFKYSPEVSLAISTGKPVVVLESTIISHGMPYPSNYQTACEVESIIRSNGGVPATIGILFGEIHIGLSAESLETLAQAGVSCIKCSRRNLPEVLLKRQNGSTTVAATMYLAHLAGLKIFVTGGIGGVHRGAEETWDVSADLIELGRTPVTVICAGAKSILDIPKTLEYLETQGVPVIGFGTDLFPAFFSASSGCRVMCRLDSAKECAQFIQCSEQLKLSSGVLIAVPLQDELLAKGAEEAIQIALKEAEELKISGSAVTPFLLKRVNELSEGESLKANIELIKQNARIGTLIACQLYQVVN
jgi:pseudouridine-5'-phosphate glycosidase